MGALREHCYLTSAELFMANTTYATYLHADKWLTRNHGIHLKITQSGNGMACKYHGHMMMTLGFPLAVECLGYRQNRMTTWLKETEIGNTL